MSLELRMSVFNRAIGEWLREARLAAGLSLEQAADCLGSDADEVQKIELGSVSLSGQQLHSLIGKYEISTAAANRFLETFGMRIA